MMGIFWRSDNLRKIVLCCFSLAVLSGYHFAEGQKNDVFADIKKKYPDQPEVILNKIKTISISVEKDNLKIDSDNFSESIILNDNINNISSSLNNVYFSSFQQLEDIKAYTYAPYKDSYKKIEIKNYREKPNLNSRTFHDDVKIKEFDYPQLSMGARKVLKYKINYTNPHLLNGMFFLESAPIAYGELKVIADQNIELGYSEFNNADHKLVFSKEVSGKNNIYTWKTYDVDKFKYEESSPSAAYYAPHVEVYVKKYKQKSGKVVNVFNDLQDLHKLYQGYISNINKNPNPELKKTADSIAVGQATEIEKVKSIYYWVKDHIKYIAFEDGYGGFIPRDASDVYNKRYGDCKDMSNILCTMLREAGIKTAYLTWTGSRDLPYSYYTIPTQIVDDHMIVVYKDRDKNYFLDATSKETPFGIPTSFIQGKECMVHLGDDQFEIVKIPVVDAGVNQKIETINLEINNQTITGEAKASFTGYFRGMITNGLYDHKGFEEMDILKSILSKGNNKFYLDKFEIFNKENRDVPLNIDYSFRLNNYMIEANNEIYCNLFMEKILDDNTLDSTRKNDFEDDFGREFIYKVSLAIPQGYVSKYVPANDKFTNDKFSYEIVYTAKPEAIELYYKVSVNYLLLKKEDFVSWNNFIDKLSANYLESISLVKSK